MRTPRPKPNKLHDELDALLDGRPVELTDELAPLAEAADALRDELAAYQLDPQVADRHLERVLNGPGTVVQLPARGQPNGWDLRRRVAAVALAAALVLAPATMASAAALPGQAMYPFKRAIEQLRIASVQWSPGREAVERTRVADTRVDEVQRLTDLRMFTQLPTALTAMTNAMSAAQAAVDEARRKGEPVARVEAQLNGVMVAGAQVTRTVQVVTAAAAAKGSAPLSGTILRAIQTAVDQSKEVLPPVAPPTTGAATPTSTIEQPAKATGSTVGTTKTSATTPAPPPTAVETTTTEPPTTTAPTTTTTPPTSDDETTPGSNGGGGSGGDDKKGPNDRSPLEVTPSTTPPGP